MTDPVNGAEILNVAGKEFRRLSPCDWVTLANHITSTRRTKLQANIKESGVAADKACELLNAFDSRPVTRGDVIDFSFLPDGVAMVLLHAIRQATPGAADKDVANIRIPQDEVNKAVLWLLGLKPKEDDKRPLAAGGESPTATGPTMPTVSG